MLDSGPQQEVRAVVRAAVEEAVAPLRQEDAQRAISSMVHAAVEDAVAPLRLQLQDLAAQVQSLTAQLQQCMGVVEQGSALPLGTVDMGHQEFCGGSGGSPTKGARMSSDLERLVHRQVQAAVGSCRALQTTVTVLANQEEVHQAVACLQMAQAWSDVDFDDVGQFDTSKLYRITTGEAGWRYSTNVLNDYIIFMSHNISLMVLSGNKRTVVLRDANGNPTTLAVVRLQCRRS